MLIPDFSSAQSVHQLLLDIFSSETGLSSGAPPALQHAALTEAFEGLQSTILDNLGKDFTLRIDRGPCVSLGEVCITHNADAILFQKLYKNFNYIADESTLLTDKVYPLIGEMILGNPEVKSAVTAQLGAHIKAHPCGVGARIYRDLLKFDLAPLVQQLRRSPDKRTGPEPRALTEPSVRRHLIPR